MQSVVHKLLITCRYTDDYIFKKKGVGEVINGPNYYEMSQLQFLQKLLVTSLQLLAALPALQYPGSYHQKTSDMES